MKRSRKRVIGGGERRACWFVAWETSRDAVWNAACQQIQSVSHDTWTHRFLQSVRFWMTTPYDLHKQRVETLRCMSSIPPIISLLWWSCRWFYYHGCVFAGNTASPANTQQIKNSACLLSLQPLDCSMIHLDNSREETAGTTLNARLCCCSMFTSLHTW